jgi:Ca-activated chloride channel family protein
MILANPLGLLALLSIPVILALHLLRERRHRQIVSNINLWSFLEREVRGALPRRIPITWLLILDLLIGILLALTLTQPQIILTKSIKTAHHFVLLIDVSASMQTADIFPTRFDRAIIEATNLINQMDKQDIATVITFGKKPTLLADTRQVDIQELINDLRNITAVEIGHEIDGAFVLGLSTVDEDIPTEFHVFTDAAFQTSRPDIVSIWNNFYFPITWHYYTGETNNQAVTDVEVQVIDDTHTEVFTRVINYGNQTCKRLLVLLSDDVPIESTDIVLPPEATITQLWRLNKNATGYTVLLSGSDLYPVDDSYSTGVIPYKRARVIYVTDKPAPIDQAIQAIPDVELTVYSTNDYSSHASADLTIFRNTLPSIWPEGTVLLIEPPEIIDKNEVIFPNRLEEPVEIPSNTPLIIDQQDPILEGIDFASVRWLQIWSLSAIPSGFSNLIEAGDSPVLLRGRSGGTNIFVLLADMEKGNFTKDPAFIILLANILASTNQTFFPNQIQLDNPIPLPKSSYYQLLRISPPDLETLEFRQNWPSLWDETFITGAYVIELQDANGITSNHVVGINAYDDTESDVRPREWRQTVQNVTSDLGAHTALIEQSIDLTPYLLIAGIFFLIMETLIAWR